MKIARLAYNKKESWGIIEGNRIRLLKSAPYRKIEVLPKQIAFSKLKLLAPATPTKLILVGLNYRDHAQELKMKIPKQPIVFLKSPSCLIGQKDSIVYPQGVRRLDYEAELAVVIRRRIKHASLKEAKHSILGYTCLNDVTARDLQRKDGQWTRAKSFDTFCPLGPWLETELDPSKLAIQSYLNKKLKQNSSTENFIFSVASVVSFISGIMTLLPGDVISTGTPGGVGRMKRGDKVEVKIQGIGTLTNYVV